MKIFLLIILGALDIIFLIATIYLWRTSDYPGAEIGNMDAGLMKITGVGFVIVSVILGSIIYLKR